MIRCNGNIRQRTARRVCLTSARCRIVTQAGFFGCLVALLAGCSPINIPASAKLPPYKETFTIAPGDLVDVQFQMQPELNTSQVVRPDGKISLFKVDEVQAAGLTPGELDRQLTQMYKKYLQEPVLTVIVNSQNSRRVFVGGEVYRPGSVPLTSRMTAFEAILDAGGFNRLYAAPNRVIVYRRSGNKLFATRLNMKKKMRRPGSEVFYLAPNDIVYVDRSKVSEVNQWIDQYISGMLPNLSIITVASPGGVAGGP